MVRAGRWATASGSRVLVALQHAFQLVILVVQGLQRILALGAGNGDETLAQLAAQHLDLRLLLLPFYALLLRQRRA